MPIKVIEGLTGVVLAGGEARRMGRINKALVTVAGVPVIDHILARLAETCAHVMVIANDPAPYAERGLEVHADVMPHHAALGGLYTALLKARTEHVFVCACDMPFLSAPLIAISATPLTAMTRRCRATPMGSSRSMPSMPAASRRCSSLSCCAAN